MPQDNWLRQIKDSWETSGIEESNVMFSESSIRGKLQMQELHWITNCINSYSKGPLKILDAGCGPGRYIHALTEAGHQVVGYDFAESMLRLAKGKVIPLEPALVQGDIQHLPFKDNQFDITLMLDVMHHLQSREMRAKAIEEAFRVSTRIVFLDVKNKLNPVIWYRYKRQKDKFLRTAYTYGEIKNLVKKSSGYISKSTGLMFPVKLIAPYILIEAEVKT